MKEPLLTRGLPAKGDAVLFDASIGIADATYFVTLSVINTGLSTAACSFIVDTDGISVNAPINVLPLSEVAAPRPVVTRFPILGQDTVRWDAPDSVVVVGYVEREFQQSSSVPEPLRSPSVRTPPFLLGDGIVGKDGNAPVEVHRFAQGEMLTLGVDVPGGETLELVFLPDGGGDEVRVAVSGPLVACEIYQGVPFGASGTLSARVTTGGVAIVYGCLVRS